MQARRRISLFLLSFTLGLAHAAPAAYPEYRITIVGPVDSQPTDINNAGAVVGTYPAGPTATRAFLNRGKGIVDPAPRGASSSDAQAITDKGEVLGNYVTPDGQRRGYIYVDGRRRDIAAPPGRSFLYLDINKLGYILALGNAADGSLRSFLRHPNGKLQDIGNLPAEDNPATQAQALNTRNQITGQSGQFISPEPQFRAFIWARGVMRDLGDLGSLPNNGQAINDFGQITGYMSVTTGLRDRVAFLYTNGRLINIDGRPAIPGRFSLGEGINNHGHIVGDSDHLGAFVYRGKRMQSLNALIDRRLGWTIHLPRAINDAGQIAASGVRNGVQYTVRLDLIRPHHLSAPQPEKNDD